MAQRMETSRRSVYLEDPDMPEDPPKKGKETCTFLKDNLLLILTIAGIVLGFILGFALRSLQPSEDAIMWLGMPGEIFLRLLKMMIIPLVVSCIIAGAASLDPKSNGKISLVTIAYVIATNALCALIGIILAVAIHPGQPGVLTTPVGNYSPKTKTQDIFADLIKNFFPDNLVSACIRQVHTSYTQNDVIKLVNVTNPDNSTELVSRPITEEVRQVGYVDGANLLGLVLASLVFGIATCVIGEPARPFYEFFSASSDIILKIFSWFLWYSPVGIASLTAAAIVGVEDPGVAFIRLGFYVMAVSIGVVLHQVVILPAISFIAIRKNPFLLYVYQIKGWLTIFATTTALVCIPYFTSGCEKFGVEKKITRFVIPFSMTTSRNGSAIYITISTLFIAQLNGIPLNFGTVIVVWLLTSVLVFALPDIPSGSIVILMIILQSTGFPISDVASLFTVEWFLDRIRSSSNGMGQCFCAVFVYGICRGDLDHTAEDRVADQPPSEKDSEILSNGKIDNMNFVEQSDEEELHI